MLLIDILTPRFWVCQKVVLEKDTATLLLKKEEKNTHTHIYTRKTFLFTYAILGVDLNDAYCISFFPEFSAVSSAGISWLAKQSSTRHGTVTTAAALAGPIRAVVLLSSA